MRRTLRSGSVTAVAIEAGRSCVRCAFGTTPGPSWSTGMPSDRDLLDRVVIDLREVTFFDSTGLYMAQSFDRWGRDNDVTVVFTRGIPAVMLALEAAGLAHRLTFSDAPEDASAPMA